MARSSGMPGAGTTIGMGVLDSGSYTLIGEVKAWNDLPLTAAKCDLTHLTSDDHAEESQAGDIAVGEARIRINFVGAQYATIDTAFAARLSLDWELTLPDGSTRTFQGWIASPGALDVPNNNDPITAEITVQGTGLPTFTAG